MPNYKKKYNLPIKQKLKGYLLCFVLFWISQAASQFSIMSASSSTVEQVVRIFAQIDYQLTPPVSEALHHGVPIVIKLRIRVFQRRDYLWDAEMIRKKLIYRITYHAVTRRYLLEAKNSGLKRTFSELGNVFSFLGEIEKMPLMPISLLSTHKKYYVLMQAKLELAALPTMLQPRAYLDKLWQLDSGWYKWSL